MSKTSDTVKMMCLWKTFQPDCRQYKPSNPLIEVNTTVEVEVPFNAELIANYVDIAGQQLGGVTENPPRLTLLGMRYVIDQFEMIMSDKKENKEDWDDCVSNDTENEHPASTSDDDDDWDTKTEETEEKSKDDWDEDWS